jgi:DNA-binding beta-propeller fold protein YncE
MGRRIDALHSTRDAAKEVFEQKCVAMKERAQCAKQTIDATMSEIQMALKQRQAALHAEVDELLEKKSRMLADQLARMLEKKADEENTLQEDEKALRRLEEAQKTGKPLDDIDKVAAGDNPDWVALRIRTLTASVEALRKAAVDPEWVRLRDDEIVGFNPKKRKELDEIVNLFGAVDGTSSYASESFAEGPLIEGPLKVGFKTWLMVRACDLHGRQRKDGGDKLICTWAQDDRGPRRFEEELVDNEDGTYKLNVVPLAEGTYTLNLAFEIADGSEPIRGSPFRVLVTTPFDYTVLGDDTLGQAGVPWVDNAAGYLRRPSGLAFDPQAEFVFVADQCNDRIQTFRVQTKESVCTFGKKGSGSKDLNTPGYIVADRGDRVIVSDTLNHRLQVLSFNRNSLQLWHSRTVGSQGKDSGQFSFPRGVALTQSGLLLVCDSGNHRIQAFDADRDFSFAHSFGSHGSDDGRFIQPYDVAVNSNDDILVTDSCHRVQVFNAKGKFLRAFGTRGRSKAGKFRHPTSIAVDNEDTIFICDQGNHRIQVFTAAGEFKHMWGGRLKKKEVTEDEQADPPPEADEEKWYGLLTPIGIAVSAAGQVLVSDYDKHVVFDY